MDGLNKSVITGKCAGCAEYKAQVACLEAEREAAIKRGVQAWNETKAWMSCAIQFADDLADAVERMQQVLDELKACRTLIKYYVAKEAKDEHTT